MNIKKIEKLDDEINQKSFEKSNKGKYYNQVAVGILKEDYSKTVSKLGYWNEK